MAEEYRKGMPILAFSSQERWEAWLASNHDSSEGLWLKIAKKDSGVETVSYAEALDSAICYGWIDGQKGAYDEAYWLQRFTRRRPRSRWSRRNRERAAELIDQGRMQLPGLREVELARGDGRWQAAYESQATAMVPGDLQEKLAENPEAKAFFATLDSRNRYAILYRIEVAKKPLTRARRIEQFVAMLSQRKKLY